MGKQSQSRIQEIAEVAPAKKKHTMSAAGRAKDRSRAEGTMGEAQGRKEGCLKGNAVGKLRNQSSG
jgi:predicted transposase YdaD